MAAFNCGFNFIWKLPKEIKSSALFNFIYRHDMFSNYGFSPSLLVKDVCRDEEGKLTILLNGNYLPVSRWNFMRLVCSWQRLHGALVKRAGQHKDGLFGGYFAHLIFKLFPEALI
nr:hypothetical protein [uncultured Pseudodesulfovibrio sp.]